MLNVKNISKTYSKGTFKAVDDISFQVNKGEIFGFLGPNGAGKTTTIKMIVGLLKPDSGKISINGIDNAINPLEAKRKFSYVPDNPEIYEKITGIEYINFLANVYNVDMKTKKELLEKYLNLFNLKDSVGDIIGSYSHGMKQKIVLTGALISSPEIFILDEPMVGLDPKSAFNLKEEMKNMCSAGNSVFFSTHVLEVAEKICDRIAIINKGKIIAMGTMEELRAKAEEKGSLEKIFLEVTE